MKIHFCDLCNESVPQTDLDEGRAFLRKGRVVCARCDRSMSHEGGPGGPFDRTAANPAPGGAPYGGHAARPPLPVSGTMLPPGPAAPYGSAPYPPPPPPRARSGAGTGLAIMALLFTGGLAFWVIDRLATLEGELGRRADQLDSSARQTGASFEQRLERSDEQLTTLGQDLRSDLRDMREWLNAEIAEGQLQAREVRGRLDEFGQRIEAMSESFGNVNRHDQELVHLQQRYTALTDELERLQARPSRQAPGGTGDELGSGGPAGLGGTAGQPQATPPAEAAPPPWMGLVEQLASPNGAERWQAVVALGETRDPAVSEFLIPSLSDEDIFIRMVTARVLGDLGSPAGIPALIEALGDSESAVREAAYLALKTSTRRDLPFDPVTEDAAERARRIKAWRDWWAKEEARLAE